MITVLGPRDPRQKGALSVVSRDPEWRGLSPFFLGPCDCYEGLVAMRMENAWQFSKVYPAYTKADGSPSREFFSWRDAGFKDSRAHRYPMGKGAVPLYSYWAGEKLTYVDARKRIYIPLYSDAVKKTAAFAALKKLYRSQGALTLWDFDGYDHRKLGMSYTDVVNSPTRKMGHAFVLAMMLEKVGFPK